MPTPIYLTGFEHGLLSVDGGGLFMTGAPSGPTSASVQSATKRNGGYALRINPAAAAGVAFLLGSVGAAITVMRIAVRLASLPAADSRLFTLRSATNSNVEFGYNAATGKFCWFGDTTKIAGTDGTHTVVAGTWYVIDFSVNRTTDILDWKVKADGEGSFTDQVQKTALGTGGGNNTEIACGSETVGQTFDCAYDDIFISTTSADWPIGDGQVVGLLPGSDGTHSFTALDFLKGDAGTQQNPTATDLWTMLDDAPPWVTARSTTDSIGQRVIRTTGYCEIRPAAALVGQTANGVRALLAYSSSTATANTGACIIRNSAGAAVAIFGDLPVAQGGNGGALADYSEITNFFAGAIPTKPVAGWTDTEINAIRWRIGGSSDISPIPTWQALMLEIDYPAVVAPASLHPRVTAITRQAVQRAVSR